MNRPNRNQVDVSIGGEVVTLRASFNFFDAAGDAFDRVAKYIFKASNGLAEVSGIHKDLLTIYLEGQRAARDMAAEPGWSADAIEATKELIEKEGISGSAMALQDFFVIAHYGGKTFEENAKKKNLTAKGEQTGLNS